MQCSEVLQFIAGLNNNVSNIIWRHADNMNLLLIWIILILHYFKFPRIYLKQGLYGCIPVQYPNICIFICMSDYSYFTFNYFHPPSLTLRLTCMMNFRDFS